VVKWCCEIPVDENGDGILDAAKYKGRAFNSFDEARIFASTVDDAFGVPQIEEQVYAVDEDIRQHEGRVVRRWQVVAYFNVELPDEASLELERITV